MNRLHRLSSMRTTHSSHARPAAADGRRRDGRRPARASAALLLLCAALWCTNEALATQGCGAAEGWTSVDFDGEAFGRHPFETGAGRYRLALVPTDHGWRIQVRDAIGNDLAMFSAPARPVDTNALNIAGWHFRNADNSGPNRGDVNAPQSLRSFVFGRLAADPALNPALTAPAMAVTHDAGGRGELIIDDYGLADLEPRQRARLVYMRFRGCLEWYPGPQPPTLADTAAPGIVAPVVAQMQACGLDAAVYRLSDRLASGREGGQRPFLEPDMDGDGQRDLVVPLTRLTDAAPGLAICLTAQRQLVLAGYSGRIGRHLDPVYFGRADWWNAVERGPVSQSGSEALPPVLRGDAILLGKEGASSVLLYLDADGVVGSYWQGD